MLLSVVSWLIICQVSFLPVLSTKKSIQLNYSGNKFNQYGTLFLGTVMMYLITFYVRFK